MLFLTTFDKLNTPHQIHIIERLFNIFTCFVMYNDLFETQNIHINVNLLKVFKKVIRKIILDGLIIKSDKDTLIDKDWEKFELYFNNIHTSFTQSLKEKFPNLSANDIKMCAYLRMNLSTKEIASILNISARGVEISRYRLRKKMDLENATNLTDFLLRL